MSERAERSFSYADISGWYDRLNRLMSLGRDQRWRAVAAEALQADGESRILDVGTGTGQMALAIRSRWPSSHVVALDADTDLMRQGLEKDFAATVSWTLGDGYQLPFPDSSFDSVVSVFLLRNVADVQAALQEQRRVVRGTDSSLRQTGGRVVALELVWPRSRVFGTLFRLYFGTIMPALNGLLSGDRAAYRYLPRSVERFDSPDELASRMKKAGLTNVRFRTLAGGAVALHVGERAA